MNNQWKRLLEDSGATLAADGTVSDFGNPVRERRAATTGSVICPLTHRGLIQVDGPDTIRFLQGQLTNDATLLSADHSQISGYCTPKGRLTALFRIHVRDDACLLSLPRDLVEPTIARLRKYVLMSKLTLAPAADDLVAIGLSGPRAGLELGEVTGRIPETVDGVVHADGLDIVRLPGIHPRYEIVGPLAAMSQLWSRLDVHAAPVGAGAWSLLDILAGIPEIWPQTVEEFIPQTLNLDLLGAISFRKGCYTGQEIIARLHYRGTVKRRMYLAHCDSADGIVPGSGIHSAGGSDQAIGQVVSAAPGPNRGSKLLVSVVVDQTRQALHLGAPDGPPLTLEDLPYLKAGDDA